MTEKELKSLNKDSRENRVKKFPELDSPELEKRIKEIVEQSEREEALHEVIDALLEAVDYLLERNHNLYVDIVVMQVRHARMEKRIDELERKFNKQYEIVDKEEVEKIERMRL